MWRDTPSYPIMLYLMFEMRVFVLLMLLLLVSLRMMHECRSPREKRSDTRRRRVVLVEFGAGAGPAAEEISAAGELRVVDGVGDGGADAAEVGALPALFFLVASPAEADYGEDGNQGAGEEAWEEAGEDGDAGEAIALGDCGGGGG